MSEGENVVLRLEAKVGAASPRPPSWAIGHTELSAGVLGETALPRFEVMGREVRDPRSRTQWTETLLRSADALLRRAPATGGG